MCFPSSRSVSKTIVDIYGQHDVFESVIRSELTDIVTKRIGPEMKLSYRFILRIMLPLVLSIADVTIGFRDASVVFRFNLMFGFTMVYLFYAPCRVLFLGRLFGLGSVGQAWFKQLGGCVHHCNSQVNKLEVRNNWRSCKLGFPMVVRPPDPADRMGFD